MLEVYLFAAMFAVQILILSILHPNRLTRRIRAEMARYPADSFPQLYPNNTDDIGSKLVFYSRLNRTIALLGLILLGALFYYMQQPGWDDGPVEAMVSLYFMLQVFPFCLASWSVAHFNKQLRNALQTEKRKATLQRRGLFDFVSPFIVFLTLLCYPLFAVLVIYIQQNPFPGFAGPVNIVLITALYAMTACCVYWSLYRKKSNPLQTNEDRLRQIEVAVKILIYSCLAGVVFLSLNFTLVLLDLQRFEPLALSLFCVIFAVLYSMGLNSAAPRDRQLSGPAQISGSGISGVQRG
jgi:hypothetical protein